MMSRKIHVGTIGRHIGDSPYARYSVTNGMRYHMMFEIPLSPTNPMTVASSRYSMYVRNRLTTMGLYDAS
jgi:hypothetical protein